MRDFAEWVCTRYTSLIRVQTPTYHDLSSTLLGDAQSRWEHLGGYHVHVGADSQNLHVGNIDGHGKRDGSTTQPQSDCSVLSILSFRIVRREGLRQGSNTFELSSLFDLVSYLFPGFCGGAQRTGSHGSLPFGVTGLAAAPGYFVSRRCYCRNCCRGSAKVSSI